MSQSAAARAVVDLTAEDAENKAATSQSAAELGAPRAVGLAPSEAQAALLAFGGHAAHERKRKWLPRPPWYPVVEAEKKAAKSQSAAGSAVPRAVGRGRMEAKDALIAVVDLTAGEAEEQRLPHGSGHPEVNVEKKAATSQSAAEGAADALLKRLATGPRIPARSPWCSTMSRDLEVDPVVENKAAMSQSAADG